MVDTTLTAQQPAEAFVQWARTHAYPVTTLDANRGDHDLDFLRDVVGDARVVGIGEAYHNAHEMLQMRHRAARYLVERLGFRAIMFESGLAQSKPVHDYVLGSDATPHPWIQGLAAGFGRAEPCQELIRWCRAYNRANAAELRVLGADVSAPLRIPALFEFMDRVNPKAAEYFRGELGPVLEAVDDSGGMQLFNSAQQLREEQRNTLRLRLEELVVWFEGVRVDAIAKTSQREYEWAAMSAANARLSVLAFTVMGDHWRDADGVLYAIRDRHMAETIVAMLDQIGPDARIVYLAHNVHVQAAPPGPGSSSGQYYTAGTHLRSLLGDGYRAIGLTFGTGEVYDLRDGFALGDVSAWDKMSVRRSGPGSPLHVNALLSSAGGSLYGLNLRQAPESGPVHQWLNTEQQWVEGLPDGCGISVPAASFAGLIYIDHITPAKLTN